MEPLRILHLVTGRRWTGVAEPVLQLALAQRAEGHDVALALEAGGDFEKRAKAAGLAVEEGIVHHSAGPWSWWRGARRLRAVAATRGLDVVHAHLTADHWLAAAALGPRAARSGRSGPLLVRTWHREERPRADPLSRWVAGRTDGAVAISTHLAASLRSRLGFATRRMLVQRGVVDAEVFRPGGDGAGRRAAWGVARDAPVAGLLARLRRARGIFTLLDAAGPLAELLPQARIVFCGRGRHAAALRRAIAAHPRAAFLHYPGYAPPDTLNDAYAAFDVAVQLAPGNDGTCRAALQSMACGRPLVAARVGALDDLLHDDDGRELTAEEGGILVAPDDAAALAAALARYLGDAALRERAGAAARALVSRRHRPEDQARRIAAFYATCRAGGDDAGQLA